MRAEGLPINRENLDEFGESEVKKVIESLEFPSFKLNFISFDDFNPEPKPNDNKVELNSSLKKIIDNTESDINYKNTYVNTTEDPNWKEKTYKFLENYLAYEGEAIRRRLGINDINDLSARQLVGLSIEIAMSLMRYSYKDGKPYGEKADRSTILEILEEGRKNINNKEWKGNGICRNYACVVKGIFESLKVNQKSKYKTQNLYCLYKIGDFRARKHKPTNEGKIFGDDTHAWNTFIYVDENSELDVMDLDATWAKYDFETGKPHNDDYTGLRMDEFIRGFHYNFTHGFERKEHKEILTTLIDYYKNKMEAVEDEDERFYYFWNICNILSGNKDIGIDELPASILDKIQDIIRNNQTNIKYFLRTCNLKGGLRKPWETIASKDKRFVGIILEEISKKDNFIKLLDENMRLRKIVREHNPEFLPRFNPKKDKGDFNEFIYMLGKAIFLKKPLMRWLRNRTKNGRGSSLNKMVNQEDVSDIIEFARENLRLINPELYEKMYRGVSNKDIIFKYNEFYKKLRDSK